MIYLLVHIENYCNSTLQPDQLEKDGTLFHTFAIYFVVIKVGLDTFQFMSSLMQLVGTFLINPALSKCLGT